MCRLHGSCWRSLYFIFVGGACNNFIIEVNNPKTIKIYFENLMAVSRSQAVKCQQLLTIRYSLPATTVTIPALLHGLWLNIDIDCDLTKLIRKQRQMPELFITLKTLVSPSMPRWLISDRLACSNYCTLAMHLYTKVGQNPHKQMQGEGSLFNCMYVCMYQVFI